MQSDPGVAGPLMPVSRFMYLRYWTFASRPGPVEPKRNELGIALRLRFNRNLKVMSASKEARASPGW